MRFKPPLPKPFPPAPRGPQTCDKCGDVTTDYYATKGKKGWGVTCKPCHERGVREETRGKVESKRKELSA